MYVCMYVCMYVYIYIYVCAHIFIPVEVVDLESDDGGGKRPKLTEIHIIAINKYTISTIITISYTRFYYYYYYDYHYVYYYNIYI